MQNFTKKAAKAQKLQLQARWEPSKHLLVANL